MRFDTSSVQRKPFAEARIPRTFPLHYSLVRYPFPSVNLANSELAASQFRREQKACKAQKNAECPV
jgi:hypothetical protein